MLEALFLLAEGGLLRLDLPLAGLDQGFSALDFLLRSGFSTRDCLRPFLEFFVSCACQVSDLSSAALRDSMSCRSERNAVSCSSKVAFNDSFDSDSFVNARSTAATSLSRRSTSPLLAAYSSSSAARRDRKSPSTTSAASDR